MMDAGETVVGAVACRSDGVKPAVVAGMPDSVASKSLSAGGRFNISSNPTSDILLPMDGDGEGGGCCIVVIVWKNRK
jgi:hypothetical protein